MGLQRLVFLSASLCACLSGTQPFEGTAVDARTAISQAIAEAERFVDQPVEFGLVLQNIAEAAESSVPGFDHASITLLQADGSYETGASTSTLALQLDNAQYSAGDGPCLDTVRGRDMVSVPRLRAERRWPSYVRQAVAAGVQSHLSVKLRLGGQGTLGGLNLYSTTTEHVSRDSEAMAEVFGSYAITDLRGARTTAPPVLAVEWLEAVGQALGMVMRRFGMDSDHALDYLDESAARADLALRDYAQQLADQDGGP